MIIVIFNFTDYLTDLSSYSMQNKEMPSSCYTYVQSSEQTSFPENKNMANTVNGFYSSNSLVRVQQSGPVCILPKGPSLVLNSGQNVSNNSSGCPLVVYTTNVTQNGGNPNGNQFLTQYTGASVPAYLQPTAIYSDHSSAKTVLTIANLNNTMPDVKNIVPGKSFQPAAYMYTYVGKNSMTPTNLYPSNFSSFGVLSSHSSKPVISEACGHLPVNDIGYKCTVCSERFNTESERSLHIREMHDKKCPYCTEVISSTSGRCYRSLLKHVVLSHKDKDPCSVAHKSTIESAKRGKECYFVLLHVHGILIVLTSVRR